MNNETATEINDKRRKIICARSVHLRWNCAMHCQTYAVTLNVLRSVPGSFFMAVGWSQGYFGIQDLGNGHSGLICSVWDSDTTDPNIVQQAKALYAEPAAAVRRFEGEGTGLQCMRPFPVRGSIRFILSAAELIGDWTLFSASVEYGQRKMHLVEYLSRTEGKKLNGFYSFIEDFRRDGDSAKQERRAVFSNPVAIQRFDYTPVRSARFTIAEPSFEGDNYDVRSIGGGAIELTTGGDIVPMCRPGQEIFL